MIITSILAVILALTIVYFKKSQVKKSPILGLLEQLSLYLDKDLDFENKLVFLEKSRQLNMNLIQNTQNFQEEHPLKKITHDLLGLILKIPRMNENPQSNELEKAIHQIEIINTVSDEIQDFLKMHIKTLIKYFS